MRKVTRILALLCCAPLGMMTMAAVPENSAGAPLTGRVIMIKWDGFDPSYLNGRADTPNINRMIAEGAYFPEVWTTFPSITNTSFSSIITGAWPDTSGIRAVWWNREENKAYGQDRIFEAETIVESLARGGLKSASVNMWLFIGRGLSADSEDAIYLQPKDEKIQRFDHRMETVLEFIRGQREYVPDLMSVYANTLDSIGHDGGPNDPRIVDALEEMDRQIGRLLDELVELGQEDETTVMIMGDHGMSVAQYSIRDNVTKILADHGYRAQWLRTSGDQGRSADPETEIVCVTFGRYASIFFKGRNVDGQTEQRPFSAEEKADVMRICGAIPNSAQLLDRDALDRLRAHPDIADFVIEARPPYCFYSSTRKSPSGMHGSTMEQRFPLIMWGAPVRHGEYENGRSIDIAPTIARLLGGPAPAKAEGRVLSEALWFPGDIDQASN